MFKDEHHTCWSKKTKQGKSFVKSEKTRTFVSVDAQQYRDTKGLSSKLSKCIPDTIKNVSNISSAIEFDIS